MRLKFPFDNTIYLGWFKTIGLQVQRLDGVIAFIQILEREFSVTLHLLDQLFAVVEADVQSTVQIKDVSLDEEANELENNILFQVLVNLVFV